MGTKISGATATFDCYMTQHFPLFLGYHVFSSVRNEPKQRSFLLCFSRIQIRGLGDCRLPFFHQALTCAQALFRRTPGLEQTRLRSLITCSIEDFFGYLTVKGKKQYVPLMYIHKK